MKMCFLDFCGETLETRTISIVFERATEAVGGVTGVLDSAAKCV
jgi:hypothetical protein